MTPDESDAEVDAQMQAFNEAVHRLGLGGRILLRDGGISLKELWPGAGVETMRALAAHQRGPDSWLGPYLTGILKALHKANRPE